MKTLFKVWNIILIVLSVISVALGFLFGGMLGGLLTLLGCILTLIMAIYGFRGDYGKARSFAIAIIVFDVLDIIRDRAGASILSLLLMIIYLILCINLCKNSY